MSFIQRTVVLFLIFCAGQTLAEKAREYKPGDRIATVLNDYGTPKLEFLLNGKWVHDFDDFIVTSTNGSIFSVHFRGEVTVIKEAEKTPEEVLLEKAMEGDAKAQSRLAYCFQTGTDFPRSQMECIKWYTAAAMQNNVVAQHNLGVFYLNGDGVKKDLTEAFAWALLAEQNGNDTLLKALKKALKPDQKVVAQARAEQLKNAIQSEDSNTE